MTATARQPLVGILLWWALCAALALPAWHMGWVPLNQVDATWPAQAQAWALHPDAGMQQNAWAWWTTAWLHGSATHLSHNLLALGLIAVLGALSRMPPRAALAWAIAWPLTHLSLLAQPAPLHTYIGLSGVLHAGVAVIAIQQVTAPRASPDKWVGRLLLLGLMGKILMENPWHHPLIRAAGSDINVAPWAHFGGALAGVFISLLISVTTCRLAYQQADT